VSWVWRMIAVSLVLFLGGRALGFRFDDGGEETGIADVLTTLAGVMYTSSFAAFGLTFLLVLAVLFPAPTAPGQGALGRVLLGVVYAAWLILPLLIFFLGASGSSGLDAGTCGPLAGWANEHSSEGSTLRIEDLSWPPLSTRCVVDGPGGHFEQVFPTPGTWILVSALAMLPWLLFPVARRLTAKPLSEIQGAG
jgi:hypothetical protein